MNVSTDRLESPTGPFAVCGSIQRTQILPVNDIGYTFEGMREFQLEVQWNCDRPADQALVVLIGKFARDVFIADDWKSFAYPRLAGVKRDQALAKLNSVPDEASAIFGVDVNVQGSGMRWVAEDNFVPSVFALELTPALTSWQVEHRGEAILRHFVASLDT